MTLSSATGFVASALVLLAFCTRDITALRAVALLSNVAFLAYGLGLNLPPVWVLHSMLLPINSWRLWEDLSVRVRTRTEALRSQHNTFGGCGLIWGLEPPADKYRRGTTPPIRLQNTADVLRGFRPFTGRNRAPLLPMTTGSFRQ